jgi:hypothetical protein
LDTAQGPNGVSIKIVTVVDRRWREKVMFAINKNRPSGQFHEVRRRLNCIEGIWWRLEQLDLQRCGWCDCHSGFYIFDRQRFDARAS